MTEKEREVLRTTRALRESMLRGQEIVTSKGGNFDWEAEREREMKTVLEWEAAVDAWMREEK